MCPEAPIRKDGNDLNGLKVEFVCICAHCERIRNPLGKIAESSPHLTESHDPVNRPKHYAFSIEVIDAIESWGLDFHLANCVKYIARAGHKDPTTFIEDLNKACWYLKRRIEKENKKEKAP